MTLHGKAKKSSAEVTDLTAHGIKTAKIITLSIHAVAKVSR
jgi:hypothetical protein